MASRAVRAGAGRGLLLLVLMVPFLPPLCIAVRIQDASFRHHIRCVTVGKYNPTRILLQMLWSKALSSVFTGSWHGAHPLAHAGKFPREPVAALQAVSQLKGAGLFVFLDMHRHFTPVTIRLIRDAIWTVKRQRKSLVFVSPVASLPEELSADATLVSYPAPEMERLRQIVSQVHAEASGETSAELEGSLRESLARGVVGLTEREAVRILRRASLARGGLDVDCLREVIQQKRQTVRKSGVLEFVEPDVTFEDVGGLRKLKAWFASRRRAFSPEGLRFGLRPPRGAVLVGVPGCGKSLSAKALAADWEVPLLRLDMGRIRGSLLGESERRLRVALQTAELASPCILWIDELEKAFAGLGAS